MTSLVRETTSVRQIIQKLNLGQTGGNYANFRKLIRFYELDTSHFTGPAWNKGLTKKTSDSIKKSSNNKRLSNEIVFSENAPPSICGKALKERLIEIGREYCCEKCSNKGVWLGEELTLQVDHINGINNDNRPENLRFLCPNCHTQTVTWGNKKRHASVAQLEEAIH